MPAYKLRAECAADVEALGERLREQGIRVTDWRVLPFDGRTDVELTFASDASLDALRRTAENVLDGHVMVETLATLDRYTGERTYKTLDEVN